MADFYRFLPASLRVWGILLFISAFHLTGLAQPVGPQHHLTLCRSGEVWGWGANDQGQLGTDPATQASVLQPQALAGFTNIMAVATSNSSSYAVTGVGQVLAWGDNDRGQLGVGSTGGSSPVAFSLSLAQIIAVTAGARHAVALRDDGTLWAWGANDAGQLGDGSTTDRNEPVAVLGASGTPLLGITAISSAGNHNLAVDANGRVYAWGSNTHGEAGVNSTAAFFSRAQLLPVPVAVRHAVASETHCAALDQRGVVYGWGNNSAGQLGDGTTTSRRLPVRTLGIPTNSAYALAGSAYSGLALLWGGQTSVWGSNANGEFGICGPTQQLTAIAGPQFDSHFVRIAGAGTVFKAADLDAGVFYTWGGPAYLGYQPAPGSTTPSGGSCRPTPIETCDVSSSQPVSCPPQAYVQRNGATYVAAHHLPSGSPGTDIGAYGASTTIDARLHGYGGKVVFSGVYHVRGNLRLIGGEFELRPGTVFVVDGVSGQPTPPTPGSNLSS